MDLSIVDDHMSTPSATEAVDDGHATARGAYQPTAEGVRPSPAPRLVPEPEGRTDRSTSDTLRELGCTEEMLSVLERAGAIRTI